jgi:hypothetical protein
VIFVAWAERSETRARCRNARCPTHFQSQKMPNTSASNSELLSVLALLISAFALAVSGLTAWLTLLRRGTVRMTQPTVIFFGPDGPRSLRDGLPKIFLRALLFSTSKRGRIVESMFVTLTCEDIVQDFTVWTYGERNQLVRGSGIFVGETGVEANHHFLISKNAQLFAFIAGRYRLDVYAHLLGDPDRRLLFSQTLEVSEENSEAIGHNDAGLYFDWDPQEMRYRDYLDRTVE